MIPLLATYHEQNFIKHECSKPYCKTVIVVDIYIDVYIDDFRWEYARVVQAEGKLQGQVEIGSLEILRPATDEDWTYLRKELY